MVQHEAIENMVAQSEEMRGAIRGIEEAWQTHALYAGGQLAQQLPDSTTESGDDLLRPEEILKEAEALLRTAQSGS